MIIDITQREEELLELLGISWNGWQYEQQNFAEINFELEKEYEHSMSEIKEIIAKVAEENLKIIKCLF